MNRYWYLASPYHDYIHGPDAAAALAAAAVGLLGSTGVAAYSPVVSAHAVSAAGFNRDAPGRVPGALAPLHRALAQEARGLIVLRLDGWEVSMAVRQARDLVPSAPRRPVVFMDPGIVPAALFS